MLIGSNSRLRRIDSIVISADGKQLKEAQCFPYLGLIINQNLTWEDHIEHMRTHQLRHGTKNWIYFKFDLDQSRGQI